ncbi:MAG: tRNA-guanine transglycosylase, partial [Alistipes sp.]|nr:tRNA-guanine transglycosylase [Alistipes sp.]
MKFTLQHKASGSKARAGEIQTDHGTILTPIFMPVGTAAAMKGIFHRDLKQEAHAQIILANTYHLYLRPGMKILEEAGGVHKFSTWEGLHAGIVPAVGGFSALLDLIFAAVNSRHLIAGL